MHFDAFVVGWFWNADLEISLLLSPGVGGVGVNCNVWGWTLVRTHWGRGQRRPPLLPPPRQAVFVNDPSFQAPSCGGASSWLVKEYKKRNPGMQFSAIPLVDVVWRRPHTLPSVKVLWLQGCLCRCASYSQKFIHILGDLGESLRPFFIYFYQWMQRTASRRPFSVLPIDSSVQVQGAPLCSCKGRTEV